MFCAKVLVQEEDRQFHDSEVDEQIPKDDGVLSHENLIGEHLVPLLCERVDKLFVKRAWWEQVHGETVSAIDIGRFVFALDREFWDEALLAIWALDRIVRLILGEQAEKLLFLQWLLAVLALFL